MSLRESTSHLHHACEAHPVGQRMAQGDLTQQEWADWLDAFRVLHGVVDDAVPGHMARGVLLAGDLALLPPARQSPAALKFAAELLECPDRRGAAYVLHGAHRRGGRVMAPLLALAGLPCAHIAYAAQAAAEDWVRQARTAADATDQARATFACLLAVMDEIQRRMHQPAPPNDPAHLQPEGARA